MARIPKIDRDLIAEPDPERDAADLRACLRARVYRERGLRHENAARHVGHPVSREVGRALSAAGEVWWQREERRRMDAARTPAPLTVAERIERMHVRKFSAEIKRRGGEIYIVGKYERVGLRVIDRDRAAGLFLLHAEGWRQYGRRAPARMAALTYLCGHDDNGLFAVRVASTIRNVRDAVLALMPAAVRKAQLEGRTVLRQGDVWIVERKVGARPVTDDVRELPESHRWDPRRRTLRHRDSQGRASHRPVKVPFPFVAVPQTTYRMGRGTGWGGAD